MGVLGTEVPPSLVGRLHANDRSVVDSLDRCRGDAGRYLGPMQHPRHRARLSAALAGSRPRTYLGLAILGLVCVRTPRGSVCARARVAHPASSRWEDN